MARKWYALGLLVLALALLSACAGAPPVAQTAAPTLSAPAVTAPTQAAPELEKVSVAIGAQGAMVYLPFDVAKALDLYKQEGLDVTLNFMSGGTLAGNAIVSGSVQFSGASLDHPIAAQAQGKDIRMVTSFTHLPGLTLVVRKDLKDKIKTVADLKGQKVGVTGIGSGSHVLLVYLMNKAGLKPDDVQIVAVGSATAVPAMQKGEVAAVMTADPFTGVMLKEGDYALVDFCTEADTTKYLGGEYQFTGMETTGDMIKNKPQTVQKMVNAMVKAERYVATHSPEEVANLLPAEVTGKDKALYAQGLTHILPALSKDGIITEAGVDNAIAVNKVFGSIKPGQTLNIPALYDSDFAKNVK